MLLKYEEEYEEIMSHSDTDIRDHKLAALMTRMEIELSIPFLLNPEWEQKNREIIEFYRKVSNSRIF